MHAYLATYHHFRQPEKTPLPIVRVLDVRRATAHIEATRRNGQVVRRYVKLSRLRFV